MTRDTRKQNQTDLEIIRALCDPDNSGMLDSEILTTIEVSRRVNLRRCDRRQRTEPVPPGRDRRGACRDRRASALVAI
jgi:hypothetical protein